MKQPGREQRGDNHEDISEITRENRVSGCGEKRSQDCSIVT